MLYKVVKYASATETDISDYVTEIDKVPYITQNRDKKLLAEGYSFKLSERCPVTIAKGDKIFFYRDTILIHNGVVDYTNLDEDSLLITVYVKHFLSQLNDRNTAQSYLTDPYDQPLTFIEVVLENSTEVAINGISYDLIGYKKLIEIIVNEGSPDGMLVDWTNIDLYNNSNFIWRCYEAGDGTLTEIDSPTVNEDNIWFLAQQINCTGINGIFAPSEFDNDKNAERPSLFELLSQLVCLRGINFVPKNAVSFYAVGNRSSVPNNYFSDDEMYLIKTDEEIIEASGVEAKYSTLDYNLWFGGYLNIPEWVNGVSYFEGDYVLYNGNYYRAVTDTSEEPTVGEGQYDWYQITLDIEMDAYLQPNFSQEGFVEYTHKMGVKPANIYWMDNFNPLIIDGSDAYFCLPVPDVSAYPYTQTGKSCAHYLVKAELISYTKTTLEVPASKIFEAGLYEFESIYVSDINNDTCEIEVVE